MGSLLLQIENSVLKSSKGFQMERIDVGKEGSALEECLLGNFGNCSFENLSRCCEVVYDLLDKTFPKQSASAADCI